MQVGPSVLGAGAQDFKGSDAKMSIIIGAMAVSDLVKSTLGPKGMVRLLSCKGQLNEVNTFLGVLASFCLLLRL